MSRTTKKKHVQQQVDDEFDGLTGDQQIVRVLNSRGNNLHEVQAPNQSTFLVSMPTKFRKNIWVKRGDHIIVELIEEGDKVKAEMVRILTGDHIKRLKKDEQWPTEFSDNDQNKTSDDDNNELFVNKNKIRYQSNNDEDSEDDESD